MSNLNIFQAIWYRMKYLYKKFKNNPVYAGLLLLISVTEVIVISIMQPKIAYYINGINNPLLQHIYHYIAIAVCIIVCIITLAIFTTPISASSNKRLFEKIGLLNRQKEPPVLVYKNRKGNSIVYEYYSIGIALSDFVTLKDKIENVLDITINEMYTGDSYRKIIIEAAKGKQEIPSYIKWDDKYIPAKENLISLGMGIGKEVFVLDISDNHVYVGGKTGSTKTNLMKTAIYQVWKRNNMVYIMDMKAVDFPSKIRNSRYFCETKDELNDALDVICAEFEARKRIFKELDYSNINEYNKNIDPPMPRVFLFCDEAYAIFKTNGTKQDADLTKEIVRKLEVIVTQARFAGIHLWLQTQRGGSDVIPGQIRSNLTYRLCGKADENLSRLTIDSPIASTITKKEKGKFYDDEEQCFQSFHFDNKQWK